MGRQGKLRNLRGTNYNEYHKARPYIINLSFRYYIAN